MTDFYQQYTKKVDCKNCWHFVNRKCDIDNVEAESTRFWLNKGLDYTKASKADCAFWRSKFNERKVNRLW